jgi:hypothetical protein
MAHAESTRPQGCRAPVRVESTILIMNRPAAKISVGLQRTCARPERRTPPRGSASAGRRRMYLLTRGIRRKHDADRLDFRPDGTPRTLSVEQAQRDLRRWIVRLKSSVSNLPTEAINALRGLT